MTSNLMRAFGKCIIALGRNTTFCLSQFGSETPVCTALVHFHLMIWIPVLFYTDVTNAITAAFYLIF